MRVPIKSKVWVAFTYPHQQLVRHTGLPKKKKFGTAIEYENRTWHPTSSLHHGKAQSHTGWKAND